METRTNQRPLFYTGVHHPSLAAHLDRAILSVNCLATRKRDFQVRDWILDSGAFTRISRGLNHLDVGDYAAQALRWARCGHLEAVVQQDFMCEPFILQRTGQTVEVHQDWTTRNLAALRRELAGSGLYVMPVLQGWEPEQYAAHVGLLSAQLEDGAWVGVGSVCKRQGRPVAVSAILTAILRERADLKLHGFGVKTTALRKADIAGRLWSADSMAWSYAGRPLVPPQNHSAAYCLAWTEELSRCEVQPSQAAML